MHSGDQNDVYSCWGQGFPVSISYIYIQYNVSTLLWSSGSPLGGWPGNLTFMSIVTTDFPMSISNSSTHILNAHRLFCMGVL